MSNAVGSVLSSVVSVLTFPVTMWLPNTNTSTQTNKRTANSGKGTDTLINNNSNSLLRAHTVYMEIDSNSEAAQTDTSSSSSTAHFTDTDALTQQPITQARTQSGKQALAGNTHPDYAGRYVWYSNGRVGGGPKIFKFARRVPPHPAMYVWVCWFCCLYFAFVRDYHDGGVSKSICFMAAELYFDFALYFRCCCNSIMRGLVMFRLCS
jgi:hypothetical protein